MVYAKDRGLFCRFLRGFFSKNAAEEVSSNPIPSSSIGRSTFARGKPAAADRPAPCSGAVAAIVAAAKLVGILQTPDSLRQKPNQEHQSKEEGETSSPAPLVRAGEARTDLAAAAACFAIRRDPTRVGKAARAWFLRLGWKNEIRGKVGDLYRDREDQIPSKSGFVLTGVESGSVACAGEEREKGGADRRVPPVRERKYGARWSEREEGKGGAVGLGRH